MSHIDRDKYLEMMIDESFKNAPSPRLRSKAGGMWVFLNSPFGIFLCSSLLLGSLSFGYRKWVEYSAHQSTAERLDSKIALRLREMRKLAAGSDSARYSNIVNISRVNGGDATRFHLHRPILSVFEKQSTISLLWQLTLLVPDREGRMVRQSIRELVRMEEAIRRLRYDAASALPDRPKAKNAKEEERLSDREDILKKDYGQAIIYKIIDDLSRLDRWRLAD
jgi:hypothetical protein